MGVDGGAAEAVERRGKAGSAATESDVGLTSAAFFLSSSDGSASVDDGPAPLPADAVAVVALESVGVSDEGAVTPTFVDVDALVSAEVSVPEVDVVPVAVEVPDESVALIVPATVVEVCVVGSVKL